jgi:hypothetical protein
MLRVRGLALSESHYVSRLCKITRDHRPHSDDDHPTPDAGVLSSKIARMVYWSPAGVGRVIRDFNRMGTAALYPNRAVAGAIGVEGSIWGETSASCRAYRMRPSLSVIPSASRVAPSTRSQNDEPCPHDP